MLSKCVQASRWQCGWCSAGVVLFVLLCVNGYVHGVAGQKAPATVQPARQASQALWPEPERLTRLADIGRGKAIVFTPDISPPGNQEFYERLGFVFIADASWERVFQQLRIYQATHPDNPLQVLLLETHSAGGNGLELQTSMARRAGRSYLSIGGLQERLAALNLRTCVVDACNAGRLFRPEIYARLNLRPAERRLLPATLGGSHATPGFVPARSGVTIWRCAENHLETVTQADLTELSAATHAALWQGPPHPGRFVVSNQFLLALLRDPRLQLAAGGTVRGKSTQPDLTDGATESLLQGFLACLDQIARRELAAREGRLTGLD